VCSVPLCRASCVKVYSILLLYFNHIKGTWIPLDMGVTWLITLVVVGGENRQLVSGTSVYKVVKK
jgi:hypothetical protein